jgi:hypothetical protein
MPSLLAGLMLLLLADRPLAQTTQQCFFPNGQVASNDVPCQLGRITHCCNNQSLCLTNGFCQSATMQPWALSRGSCTDQGWGSDCPSRCRGGTQQTEGYPLTIQT